MVTLVDSMSIEMGAATGATAETETSIEEFNFREVPEDSLRPVTVMNTVSPLCFAQGHRWITGEIHIKAEVVDFLHHNGTGNVDYLPVGTASPAVPYFVVTIVGHDAASYTYTFTGTKITGESMSLKHGGEGVTVIRFVATSVAVAAV